MKQTLERRAEQGQYVSFIHDYPEIPEDVANIFEAYIMLRASTAGDRPIAFRDKIAAWEIFGREDFETFAGFIAKMDDRFLEKQSERMKRERERQQAQAKAGNKKGGTRRSLRGQSSARTPRATPKPSGRS